MKKVQGKATNLPPSLKDLLYEKSMGSTQSCEVGILFSMNSNIRLDRVVQERLLTVEVIKSLSTYKICNT